MSSYLRSLEAPDRTAYADSAAFIRVKEKRVLLNGTRLSELANLSPEAILERLGQPLGLREGSALTFDEIAGQLLAADYADTARFDHLGLVLPLLRARFDVHNLKALLRRRRTGSPALHAPVPGNHTAREIEEHLSDGRALPWPDPVAETLAMIRREEGDGRPLPAADLLLDLAWLRHGREHSASTRLPLLSHWFRCQEDFAAVRLAWRRLAFPDAPRLEGAPAGGTNYIDPAILRARDRERLADSLAASFYGPALREGLLEWRATGNWAAMDRDIDNFLLGELAPAKFQALGPEPLAAYLLARENDLRNARLIYTFKRSGWPAGLLKKYLRRVYV